ncbi:flavohemoprotein, partial [Streptomyces lonarensis]|nr:flavohemoprotein [Streptomyces lonarensis]
TICRREPGNPDIRPRPGVNCPAAPAPAARPVGGCTRPDSAGPPPFTAAPPPPGPGRRRAPSADAVLIRRTLAEIAPVADDTTSHFYALLFLGNPELRQLFPAAMDTQRDRLFSALLGAAERLDDSTELSRYLSDLGRGHRKYGTRPEHYPAVGQSLLGALARYAARVWDPATRAAWIRAYTVISQTMIDAAAADEQRAPAWWEAEVVSHELRTSDVAVITVRPDQPYRFTAGQYAGVETPWWPRVWRTYSFAKAPDPDGLLTFHVKAVPAGWVSGALVRRATVGSVIRLGPPAGSMTVDHSSDTGLLCLAGSTGIAPIKALVEDVAEHGRGRPVELFFGARRETDLYELPALRELERRHRWLSVRTVVADGAERTLAGQLPDTVRRLGPWREYDGYLSGPAAMVRSGVSALTSAGIPAERIRHDFVDIRT